MSDVTTETKTQPLSTLSAKIVPLKITRRYELVTEEEVWITSETYTKFLDEQRYGGGEIHDLIIERISDDLEDNMPFYEQPYDTTVEENIFHWAHDSKQSDNDVLIDDRGLCRFFMDWKRNRMLELDERFVQKKKQELS